MHRGKVRRYRSYVLRCWQEQEATPDHPPVWRFVLLEISGGQRRLGFASYQQMADFLRDELVGCNPHQAVSKPGEEP